MPGRGRRSRKTAADGFTGHHNVDPFGSRFSFDDQSEDKRGPGLPTRGFWWAIAHRIWLAPVLAGGALPVTALALHSAASGLAIAAITAGLASAGMWWAAPRKWEGTEIMYARWGTLTASGWVTVAAHTGVTGPMALLLAAGWGPAALLWWMHKLPRPPKPDPLRDMWALRWEEIRSGRRISLAGSAVIDAEGDENFPRLLIQLVAGEQTVDDLRAGVPLIESAWRLPSGSIKITATKDASQAWLGIRKIVAIDSVVKWNPAHAPRSFNDPFWVGRSETGEDKFLSLPYTNVKGVGMTRWGKSNFIDAVLAACAYCDDVIPIVIDLKQGRGARIWIPLLGGFAASYEEAVELVAALNAMREERSRTAGGPRQVVISRDCPAYLLIIDEMAAGVGSSAPDPRLRDALETYAQQGTGLGFTMIGFGQDGSLETWGTEKLRAACMVGVAFKTDKNDHSSYVLKNAAAAATSTFTRKGTMILNDGNADSDRLRTPWMEPDDDPALIGRIITERAEAMCPGDPTIEHAGGDAWRDRWARLPREFWQDASPAQRKAAQAAQSAQPTATQPGDRAAVVATTHSPRPAVAGPDTEEAAMLPSTGSVNLTTNDTDQDQPGLSPAQRAAAAQDEVLAITDKQLPPEFFAQVAQLQAEGRLELPTAAQAADTAIGNVARLLANAGEQGVQPRTLYYPREKPNPRLMSKSWVMARLKACREAQVIEQVPGAPKGTFRPVDFTDPQVAYERIRAAFDDVTAQASAPPAAVS